MKLLLTDRYKSYEMFTSLDFPNSVLFETRLVEKDVTVEIATRSKYEPILDPGGCYP